MALANVPISSGSRSYSGITMKYTMTVNSITKSGNAISVNYTLKSQRTAGSSHPYASIQSYLNGSEKRDSGYNSYSAWPGAEGSKSYTDTTGTWGNNFTLQVRGNIGGNALTGSVETVLYNTLSYSSAQGTVPASQGQYTGNSVTVGSLTNLPNAYRFDYWYDANGNQYAPGATITFNQANVALTAHLTLLKPTLTGYSLTERTETTINYGALTADISGCTFQYKVGDGNWQNATSSGGQITELKPNINYTIYFKAIYSGNESDSKSASMTTYDCPYITSISPGNLNAGTNQTVYLYNPLGRSVTVTTSVNDSTVRTPSTTGTSIAISVSNAEVGSRIAANTKTGTVKYATSYTAGSTTKTSNKTATITITEGNPTVDQTKIANFITLSKTDAAACPNGTADTSHFIQGKTVVTASINPTYNPFSAINSANLNTAAYTIKVNEGTPTTFTLSSSTIPINLGTVPSASTYKVTITATDTRGFSSSCSTTTYSTVAYSKPSVFLQSVNRASGFGTSVAFTSIGNWCPNVNNINGNGASFTLYYTGGSQSLDKTNLNKTNQSVTGTFSSSSSYNFYLIAIDKYGESTTSNTVSIARGEPIFYIDTNLSNVGVNCFANKDYDLDVKGNLRVTNTINNTFYARNGNQNNYSYHRIAYTPTRTGSWVDNSIVLLITCGYNGGSFGIIKCDLRTNNVAQSAEGSASATWLVRKGFTVDQIVLGLTKTSGETFVDVFLKMTGTYQSAIITPLFVGKRGYFDYTAFSFCNSIEVDDTSASDPKSSVECYASTSSAIRTYTNIINATDAGTVNYANSAGSATSATNATNATNATKADYLTGFSSKATGQSWGATASIGSFITGLNDDTGGAMTFRKNCPNSGQMSIVVDGRFYQNEGNYMCLDTNNWSSYCPVVYSGSGDPAASTGKNGDIYVKV